METIKIPTREYLDGQFGHGGCRVAKVRHLGRLQFDPRSTVNPVNVANTCARCHADANYMKGYSTPADQVAKYSTSVHHDALAVRGDLSAPTCSTCHGNHGAVPPGVDRVENVCSTCHVFQAQMYEKSSHKAAFQATRPPTKADRTQRVDRA